MKKMKVVRSTKKFNKGGSADEESVAERVAKMPDKYKINEETGERYFSPRYAQNETGGYGALDEEYTPPKSTSKPKSSPKPQPVSSGRGTSAGKTAEQEEELSKKTSKKSDEVPDVAKIKKEQEGTSEGTSTSEKLKAGASDTLEKVLGAAGAGAGAAALGRKAYKMAQAPLGFMGEAKRMASNVGQSLKNAMSGRKPSAAGEGAAAAKEATKSVGPSQFEKAKTAAQRAKNTKQNIRDAKQPKPTEDELDIIRMGSDMKRGGRVHKYDEGGRIEVRGKKPSLAERAAGMAEMVDFGPVGSIARAVGMAKDLKQRKAQDEIIDKRKSAPERKEMAQRAKERFESVDPSEEPYKKGGSVGSASRRGDGIAMRGKTRGKMY